MHVKVCCAVCLSLSQARLAELRHRKFYALAAGCISYDVTVLDAGEWTIPQRWHYRESKGAVIIKSNPISLDAQGSRYL